MNVKLVFLAESCKLEVENFQKHKFLYFSTFRHAFRCNLSLRAKRSNPKFLPAITGFPLQSWLKFTNSFSFHFSKLPRQNFLQKFCHPFKEGEFFTFSTLKTIDARFARAKKHLQNLSLPDFRDKLYGTQPQNAIFFYKPFVPTEHFFENCFIIKLFSPKFKFYPIFSNFNK